VSKRVWILVATVAGCSLASSGCELLVGSGNYSSDAGGDNGGSSSGGSGGGCVTVANVTICKDDGGKGIGLGNSSGGSASGVASSTGGSSSGGSSTGSASGGSSTGSASGGSSGGSSSGADTAAPFTTLTSLTIMESFSDCNPASYDTSASNPASSETEPIAVVEKTSTSIQVTTMNSNGDCVFTLNTYQSGNDYLASAPSQSCAVTNATSGVTTTSTYTTFVVELPKGTTSASVTATGTATATQRGTTLTTCSSAIVTGTASE
jgi:hypothetical protein